jgi:protein phosphatase
MTVIKVPDLSLVVLVGISGSGKSTFAARHCLPTEVISSDFCRGLVSDDPDDQTVTADAFDVLHYIAGKRLAAGRLTVIDATSVQPAARKSLIELARTHHVLSVAIVLDLSEAACAARNAARPDRAFGRHVLRQQHTQLRHGLGGLRREGFRRVFVLRGEAEVDAAVIEREPLWNDRRGDHGPFDIIGDVHGCYDELAELLGKLGYTVDADGASARHPEGRTAVFVGDLVDRGPATPAVLRLAMGMTAEGSGVSVAGNHEAKLVKALRGRDVTVGHGLAQSLAQLGAEPPEFSQQVAAFADRLLSHLVFDDGKLVVAHAGLPAAMHRRASAAVRAFALYGDTTGETDEYGLPVRYPWAQDYRGRAMVVYGHTPVPETVWVNGTICLDTGCVFGGRLTALRYPERELVSVPARKVYYEPARPLAAAGQADADRQHADAGREPGELDIGDVTGKRIIETRLTGSTVTIREENAAAALEVMSRFAIDPRWLIYLPPTMSPPETSAADGLLEHPSEAFGGYRAAGLLRRSAERAEGAAGFVAAYRRYCWPVASVDDLRLAPFQVLAGEGSVHARRGHGWHLEVLGRLCDRDPALLRPTRSVTVELGDAASEDAAIAWWRDLTAAGGEGMVVKPSDAIYQGPKGLVQPGVKCRGPEYLRLIYGPEYSAEQNLARLRSRSLGHKRSLALREFALGIEGLERFAAGEPLYRVHECVFGVLALESEPVDPRL